MSPGKSCWYLQRFLNGDPSEGQVDMSFERDLSDPWRAALRNIYTPLHGSEDAQIYRRIWMLRKALRTMYGSSAEY